jgi:hypothetical protein
VGDRGATVRLVDNAATDRERTGATIHDRLPAEWHVGPPSYDPGRGRWEVVARSPKPPGRRSTPHYVIGGGPDELAALKDLATRLSRG